MRSNNPIGRGERRLNVAFVAGGFARHFDLPIPAARLIVFFATEAGFSFAHAGYRLSKIDRIACTP